MSDILRAFELGQKAARAGVDRDAALKNNCPYKDNEARSAFVSGWGAFEKGSQSHQKGLDDE